MFKASARKFRTPPGTLGLDFADVDPERTLSEVTLCHDRSRAASWATHVFPRLRWRPKAPSEPSTRIAPRDAVVSLLRRAAPGELQRPCGYAWSGPTPRRGGVAGRMVRNVSRRDDSVDVLQAGRSFSPLNRLHHIIKELQQHYTCDQMASPRCCGESTAGEIHLTTG